MIDWHMPIVYACFKEKNVPLSLSEMNDVFLKYSIGCLCIHAQFDDTNV